MILWRRGACRTFHDAVWEDRNDSSKTLRIVDEDDNNNNNLSVTARPPHPANLLRVAKVYCYMHAAEPTERSDKKSHNAAAAAVRAWRAAKVLVKTPFARETLRLHCNSTHHPGVTPFEPENRHCTPAPTQAHIPPLDRRPLRVFFTRPNRPLLRRQTDRTPSPSSGLVSVCCWSWFCSDFEEFSNCHYSCEPLTAAVAACDYVAAVKKLWNY